MTPTFEQIHAMSLTPDQQFDIGVLLPNGKMHSKVSDGQGIAKLTGYLKAQNCGGAHIYIRPAGESHHLTLIDDLTSQALKRMAMTGFQPAVIVETSPGNFQAWMNHGRALPKELLTALAKRLAKDFDGDPSSADWRHYGRLAGFTNRKEKHRRENGQYPFCTLQHSRGNTYFKAESFISEVAESMVSVPAEKKPAPMATNSALRGGVKTIDDFYADPRYSGDLHRADIAFCMYCIGRGLNIAQIKGELARRDLAHKGGEARQHGYVERTLQKARRYMNE